MKKFFLPLIGFGFLLLTILLVLFPFSSRPLFEQEMDLAQEYFGSSIEYSKIKIKKGGLLTLIYPGFTFANTISFPVGQYDYEESTDQALLLHELTHVWQYQQNGLSYLPEALYVEIFTSEPYVVHYDSTKSFFDYDVEEQGEIVADFFLSQNPDYAIYIESIQAQPLE